MNRQLGFALYLLFTVSWFLHLTARLQILGAVRFDLILIVLITIIIFLSSDDSKEIQPPTETDTRLRLLALYILLTIPFVEWPGSVVRYGIENLLKALVFYYFTVHLIYSERALKTFIYVFLGAQTFRVLEPLYLHVTEGYWGSVASMANWEDLDRLSGAPSDTINPNGLAFVILTILPFFYFLCSIPLVRFLSLSLVFPTLVYELTLTGSRSGYIGLLIILIQIVLRAKRKLLFASLMIVIGTVIIGGMTADQEDRLLSIFESGTKNAGSAQGRIQGVIDDFTVGLHRPLFGHGLGTSKEANANFGGKDQISHDLYTEVFQELGLVGLLIFLTLIVSIIRNNSRGLGILGQTRSQGSHLYNLIGAMQVWLIMNILFSFASYGLSSYEWYLFAGLSVVSRRLVEKEGTNLQLEAVVR